MVVIPFKQSDKLVIQGQFNRPEIAESTYITFAEGMRRSPQCRDKTSGTG